MRKPNVVLTDDKLVEAYREWRKLLEDAKKKQAMRALHAARTPNLWSN